MGTLALERTMSMVPTLDMMQEEGLNDSFGLLHQNTLLSCLSSLAEVAPGSGGGWGKSEEARRIERMLDAVLNTSDKGPAESAESGEPPLVAVFNVEFTTAQLRRMQRAVRDQDPKVAGAQGLLQEGKARGCPEHHDDGSEAYGRETARADVAEG